MRCGNHLRSTLVTGVITARKASEFSSTRTETNTRACGQLTRGTARELTGRTKAANSDVNTQATGMKTRSTEEELSSTKMATDTMDTGSTGFRKEKAV